MRLLEIGADGSLSLVERLGKYIPKYAILSHTWGEDHEEVTYKDFMDRVGESKPGYRKLEFCSRQAANDGLRYFWIDTCCIDKSSSAELAEAINSMFRWYRDAVKCYALLLDVSTKQFTTDDQTFRRTRWFTRGWTLQELLAPRVIEFFSQEGERIGDRESLVHHIVAATHIPIEALQGKPLAQFSLEERLSWLGSRETKREEDAAYCLLGLFDVHMPLIYGEGKNKAFIRLRHEIDNTSPWPMAFSQNFHLDPSTHSPNPMLAMFQNMSLRPSQQFFTLTSTNTERTSKHMSISPTGIDDFKLHRAAKTTDVGSPDTKKGSVDDFKNTNDDADALLKEILKRAVENSTVTSRGAPKSHNPPDSHDGTVVNVPVTGRRNTKSDTSTLKVSFGELREALRNNNMLQNTDLASLFQSFVELGVHIHDELPLNHMNLRGIKDDLSSALEQRHAKAAESQRQLEEWLDVVKFDERYGTASYNDKQLSARLEGTCQWIFEHPSYIKWVSEDYEDKIARILWICAPAGHGKTVLCAQLIEHLKSTASLPLAYFFSSPHAQAGGEPTYVIRYWIARMAQANQDVMKLVQQHSKADHRAPEPLIWRLFRTIVSEICSFTFVLDGFDEYSQADNTRVVFLHKLKKAIEQTSCRILITSRIEPDIESELFPMLDEEAGYVRLQCKITEQEVRADVSLFSNSVVNEKLPNKDGRLRLDLAQQLAAKCDGMFLWIRLQQDQLRGGKNAKQLQGIVNKMPVGLTRTYERNWEAIQILSAEDKERALSILEWIIHAYRPLTVAEITEALIITSDRNSPTIEWDELPDDIDEDYINSEIVGICGGLVETRETTPTGTAGAKTVHLIHSSVREFLLQTLEEGSLDISNPSYEVNQPSAWAERHERLAKVCVACLDHKETWQRFKAKPERGWSFTDYAAKHWHSHASAAGNDKSDLNHVLKKFFRADNECFDFWLEQIDNYEASADLYTKETASEVTSLYYAALFNFPEIVDYILSQDPTQLNKVGGRYGTPLQAACFKGHEATFKLLLRRGADPNVVGGYYGVAINAAIDVFQQSMVKALLAKGADLTLRDPRNRTPFYTAARNGNYVAICWLIVVGADEETPNDYNWTPLNAAASGGHLKIVQLLLERGADMNAPKDDGATPTYTAAENGHLDVVKLLVDKGADFEAPDKDGWTPLYTAASNGHLSVVRFLLERNANVLVQDSRSSTALHAASRKGHIGVAKLLLENNADVTVKDVDGGTAVTAAAYNGQTEILKLLLEKESDLNVQDKDGWTPLFAAAVAGHSAVIRLLLDRNVDITLTDVDGCTPLFAASCDGHHEIVKLLLDKKADPSVRKKGGGTAVFSAAYNGHIEVVRLLIAGNADLTIPDDDGCTTLFVAASKGHLEIVKLLLEHNADHKPQNTGGGTAIFTAAYNGYPEIVKVLLEHGADPEVQNMDGCTSLFAGASRGHLEVVKILLEHGSDPRALNKSCATALYSASFHGYTEIVKLLLAQGAEDVETANIEGCRALFVAARNGHLEIAKCLLEQNADVTVKNKFGGTPIFIAALQGQTEVFKLLMPLKDVDLEIRDEDGWTPIYAAALNGHEEIVKILIEKKVDIAARSWNGLSPMDAAATRRHTEIVKLLLAAGADANGPNTHYGSFVHLLAVKGSAELLRLVREQYNANLHFIDIHGRTLLHLAAWSGDIDTFEYLRSQGVEPDRTDAAGDGLLRWASSGRSTKLLEAVLKIDAVAPSTSNHWTALHWACRSGDVDVVERLVQEDMPREEVTTVEPEGSWSPAAIAIFHGRREMLDKLSATCKSWLVSEADATQPDGKDHNGAWCNGCLFDIYGTRFKCKTCLDFDYCFMCKANFDGLHKDHGWECVEPPAAKE